MTTIYLRQTRVKIDPEDSSIIEIEIWYVLDPLEHSWTYGKTEGPLDEGPKSLINDWAADNDYVLA